MFKLEKKDVTYKHEVDGKGKEAKEIPRGVSVTPNSSLTETVDKVGNPHRLKIQYNVGKNPETKNVQTVK